MTTVIADKMHQVSESLELSQSDVAGIIGSSPRTVSRWATGAANPQPAARQRLLALSAVAEELTKVIRPEAAGHWLLTPNRALNHDTPAERIRNGDARSVLALIEALADGVELPGAPPGAPEEDPGTILPSFNHEPDALRRFRESGYRSTLTIQPVQRKRV